MNDYNWYLIFNKTTFEATGLVSQEIELVLVGIGLVTILVTKGRFVSMVYDGAMLSLGLLEDNPFIFAGYAAYVEPTGDVYLGVPIE